MKEWANVVMLEWEKEEISFGKGAYQNHIKMQKDKRQRTQTKAVQNIPYLLFLKLSSSMSTWKTSLFKCNPDRKENTSATQPALCRSVFFAPRKEELLTRLIRLKILIWLHFKSSRVHWKKERKEFLAPKLVCNLPTFSLSHQSLHTPQSRPRTCCSPALKCSSLLI